MTIALVGFSTTGKSTVGRIVAERLGWRFVDTDAEIERRTGRTIPDIFSTDGEQAFRTLEREVVEALAGEYPVVISTGGGAVLDPENRARLRRGGLVVLLEARPDTIVERLQREAAGGAVRPLLTGDDPIARVRALKDYRQPFYAEAADWTVHTDVLPPEEVADEILRAFRRHGSRPPRVAASGDERRGFESVAPYCEASGAAAFVRTPGGSYPIFVGHGILAEVGQRIRNVGLQGRCWILVDRNVRQYAEQALASITSAGLDGEILTIDSGEEQKHLQSVAHLYDQLLSRRIERRDVIVGVGGGVLGDMVGFAAATVLRGIALVHVPTTLLAMVDSSIGGKTGVNHAVGKNLIGAFYQPRLVVSDVETLATLPRRERSAGWAEVIKHALIADAGLLDDLEANADAAQALDPELSADLIGRSAAIKAAVVTADERETGVRMHLNYGHTVGHAIEQSTGYGTYLHGEAVAIGMRAAALLSRDLGLIDQHAVDRQQAILRRYRLPERASISPELVLNALQFDKKVRAGTVRWIVLERVGAALVRSDIPPESVRAAIEAVTSAS